MPLIPALERQRQADLCEFEASLVCRVSFRTKPRKGVCHVHAKAWIFLLPNK